MTFLGKVKAAGKWLASNVWVVVVALVAMLGAGVFWGYHRGKIRKLEDEKAIAEAHAKVAALDAEREALEERREENADRIAELRKERRILQEDIVSIQGDVAVMDDDELEAAFRDLF